jgi:hypothetical protein
VNADSTIECWFNFLSFCKVFAFNSLRLNQLGYWQETDGALEMSDLRRAWWRSDAQSCGQNAGKSYVVMVEECFCPTLKERREEESLEPSGCHGQRMTGQNLQPGHKSQSPGQGQRSMEIPSFYFLWTQGLSVCVTTLSSTTRDLLLELKE